MAPLLYEDGFYANASPNMIPFQFCKISFHRRAFWKLCI